MGKRRDEITDAVRQRIVAGLHLTVIRPGDRLPSLRRLAEEHATDPRVVLAAYRQLEQEGLVEIRARSGVFVAHHAVSQGEMLPQMAAWVMEVLMQALARGVPAIEFPERVRRCLKTVQLKTACIECNEDQITGLCEELARDYGLDTSPVDITEVSTGMMPSELTSADLLVTTRFHTDEVERLAGRLEKPCITVTLRPDFLAEITRLMSQGPVYFVAKDPRFAGKLRAMFATNPGAKNLRISIIGRDDLAEIPEGVPTYVMRAALGHMEGLPLHTRVIPAPRIFSADSAKELLNFIISANIAAITEDEAQSGTFSR